MPIPVSCSNCAAKFKAPDQAAGRKTKCPKCGGEILIAAAPKPAAPRLANAQPPVRLPMAQAVLPAQAGLPDLPPLASEFSAARPAFSGQPLAQTLPQVQPASARSALTPLWYVLGILGASLFLAIVLEPFFREDENAARAARQAQNRAPQTPEAQFEAIVAQAASEYVIPPNERVTPRPPASLTPRESQLLFAINGDRLGMTTEEFRTKYRHPVQGDNRPTPMMSDHRHREARRSRPLDTLLEEPWHPEANIVHARITWPFEDNKENPYTPRLGGSRAMDHLFMFVDEQLWRIQYVFPSQDFPRIKAALVAQLGPPDAVSSTLGLGLRGSNPGAVHSWTNAVAQVDFIEHTLEGNNTNLVVRHLALEKVDTNRNLAGKAGRPIDLAVPPSRVPPPAPSIGARPPTPGFDPRTSPSPIVRRSASDELSGDRLGMSLADFRARHQRRGDLDGKQYPLTSDTYSRAERERAKLTAFSEPVWHARANIVNAILSSPDELTANSPHVPRLGNTFAVKHVYRFLDQKLSSIEYLVPRAEYDDVVKFLTQTYGPPSIDRENLKELYTKKHGGEFLYWSNGNTEMFLVERYDDGEKTMFFFADVPLQKETMKRRSVILGK